MNWAYSQNLISDGKPGAYLLDLFMPGKWQPHALSLWVLSSDFTGGHTELRYWS